MTVADRNKQYLDTSTLPAVPHLLVELLKLCHDEGADFDSFARIIEQEPGLSARVLQLANSPSFRQWNNINDLRRMLIVLGLSGVKTVVITSAVEQFFSRFGNTINQQVRAIWLRSLVCANLCERLARLLGFHSPGEAFLAGLLHQIGMLILLKHESSGYLSLLEKHHGDRARLHQQEIECFGFDHCQLGADLVAGWNLDGFIADAVRFQNAPTEDLSGTPPLLKILAVASVFNCGLKRHENTGGLSRATQLLGLTEETTAGCIDDAITRSTTMLTALGLDDAFCLIRQFHDCGTLPEDESSSRKLDEAIKHLALSRAASDLPGDDLIAFTRQVRVGFAALFPMRQMIFLRRDDDRSGLIPVNDLHVHQLTELCWSYDDSRSQVSNAFSSRSAQTLNVDDATISDRQLLRLLDSDDAVILPLLDRDDVLAVIALSLENHRRVLSPSGLNLMSLFAGNIARNYARLDASLRTPAGLNAAELKKLVHEINNPLSIIRNYLHVLGKNLTEDASTQANLKAISEEIDRVGRILLHARNPQPPRYNSALTDVNQLIRDIDQLLRASLYHTGKIISAVDLDERIPLLACPADKLKQILINLLKNAAEALANGGRIEISTRDGVFQQQQEYIEITVRDDGPGIAPAIMQQLFKPVVSTKSRHSGLGLAVVSSLIKDLRGTISCCLPPGGGTEFKILLPRTTGRNDHA